VELIRALGGGWSRGQLPTGESVLMPFKPLQYSNLRQAPAAGGITTVRDPASTDLSGSTKARAPLDSHAAHR
jgi:hypothetical protein